MGGKNRCAEAWGERGDGCSDSRRRSEPDSGSIPRFAWCGLYVDRPAPRAACRGLHVPGRELSTYTIVETHKVEVTLIRQNATHHFHPVWLTAFIARCRSLAGCPAGSAPLVLPSTLRSTRRSAFGLPSLGSRPYSFLPSGSPLGRGADAYGSCTAVHEVEVIWSA